MRCGMNLLVMRNFSALLQSLEKIERAPRDSSPDVVDAE